MSMLDDQWGNKQEEGNLCEHFVAGSLEKCVGLGAQEQGQGCYFIVQGSGEKNGAMLLESESVKLCS